MGERNGPWTGVTFHDGSFYIAEGGQAEGGKILKVSPAGEMEALVGDLPGMGDHHPNGPVIHNGYIYFGQGTATNSGVVGEDNADFGWLLRNPGFHDIPCEDIVLTGENYTSANVGYPNQPPEPAAVLGVHSSSNGLDFSTNAAFGYRGEAFIAQFGDMAPGVGKVLSPVGFKVVRVNVENGVVRDFAVNKGKRNGPASWLKSGGLERPLAVKFDPSGEALYIADFGVMRTGGGGPQPQVKTGVIWKITKTER